ncbi:pre-mRNA 3'-end-processing factor FIP1-like [Pseudophryne corroboree]|uniref:pre-mRNA 3'-end-processing factor FIP1-like n=1 Tax=Pseudophryne corroboree TaxID=495146 RepID=UPI003081A1B4
MQEPSASVTSPGLGDPSPDQVTIPCADSAPPMAGEGLAEELWLYGGSPRVTHDEENGSTPGHTRSSDTMQDISNGTLDQNASLQQVPQSCSDEDESSTDSDDVKVTIGDIRTGAPSCMSAMGNQNVKGGRGYGAAGSKLPPRGIDFAASGCINGLPVIEVDLDSFEEKPWRKPGADLSDYFNYGFNEATWKVYCEKQRRLQSGLDSTYHQHSKENKITVQQGRMGNADKGEENGFENTNLKYNNPACREETRVPESSINGKQGGATYETDGEICNITRVEGRRWDIPESNDLPIEVVGNQEYKSHPMMMQHQQPPPPLLPPPTIAPNPPPFSRLPPPPLFFQRPLPATQVPPALHPPALMPPPLLPPPMAHMPPPNGPPVTYNSRPPPCHSYFSSGPGMPNYHPVSNTQSSWVTTMSKGSNSLRGHDWTPRRQRDRELDRVRNQNSNNYKIESDRYINYTRGKSYDYERKYMRSRERPWEKEDKLSGEHRQREKEESSKHKSRRQSPAVKKPPPKKQDSEDRETHRRHKRKKSKRGKEEKSGDEEPTRGNRRDRMG